jgi:3-deoxy-manno-octulosonate cytidylyltransferase (CMP-KDO synthetase)
MKIIGIIPARMGSSRYPGKPLVKILDKTMVEHVYRRSEMSNILDGLYVATPDKEIKKVVEEFGGNVIMTSPKHNRCTDRIAEAAENIDCDIVFNIQGDEPLLYPEIIDECTKPFFEDKSIVSVNPIAKILNIENIEDRNDVKVVCDQNGYIMYYSREPIPSRFLAKDSPMFKLVCIMPFTKKFLMKFTELDQTPLEKIESIDNLRILEHGYKVKAVEIPRGIDGVDTPEDREKVEKIMMNDPLYQKYKDK